MRRRNFLALTGAGIATAGLAACGGSSPGGGGGGATTLRLAFNQTENHPQYIAFTAMGERLSERTDGAYTIEVYPNETLGAQQEAIQLLQDGSLELAMVGGAQMENFSEDFIVFNLPFVFDSQDHQRAVTNDPEIIGELYASLEGENISVLAGLHGGIRNVYNARGPVVTPEDMAGLKIRVQESDTHIEMLNLMGGSATPMAQGEVYTALQSGVLDGAENNELVFNDLKHAEVAPYYSYTRHLMVPDYLIAHPSVLADMTEEHRAIFEEELATAVEEEGAMWLEKVEEAISAAETNGAQINDDVDAEAFRAILAPFSEESVPQSEVAQALYQATRDAV
jgi:tripartite ATP-independent transporter DctP family solute receptor